MPKTKRNPYLSPQEIHSTLSSPLVSFTHHQHPPSHPPSKPFTHKYTPTSQNLVSIFDIPLIFDQICANLSNVDVLACMAVCKQWALLAKPHHWCSFCYLTGRPGLGRGRKFTPPPPITSTVPSLLSEKLSASWVRSLTLDLSCPPLLVVPFSNLVFFHLDCEEFSESEIPAEDLLKAVELLCRNPRLQELTIKGVWKLACHFDHRVLQFLRNSSLRFLDIGSLEYASLVLTQSILESCPDTLEELRLHMVPFNMQINPDSDNSLRPDARATPVVRILPSLRLLDVNCTTLDSEMEIFVRDLIHSCPSLEKLFLNETHGCGPKMTSNILGALTNTCLALNSINMGNANIKEIDILRLIERCSGIRNLQMHLRPDHLKDVIPSLTRRHSSTLQVLHFNIDNLPPNDHGFISTILGTCSSLKKLSVDRTPRGRGIALQDLLSAKWATTSLESLYLHIRAPILYQDRFLQEWKSYQYMCLRQDEIEPESEIANFSSQVLLLRRFYEMLQAQPNLTSRQLSWQEGWLLMPHEFAEYTTWGYMTIERLQWMALYLKPLVRIDKITRDAAKQQQYDRFSKKLRSCNITVAYVHPLPLHEEKEEEEEGRDDGRLDLSSS